MRLQDKAKLRNIHPWRVEDYHHMIENGVLTDADRVELLKPGSGMTGLLMSRPRRALFITPCGRFLLRSASG